MNSALLKTFFFAFVIFYFSYHLVSGDKGVMSMVNMVHTVDDARIEGANVQSEKEKLERRVSMLNNNSLDPDLLDEQARRLLGHVGKGEVVYISK